MLELVTEAIGALLLALIVLTAYNTWLARKIYNDTRSIRYKVWRRPKRSRGQRHGEGERRDWS